MSVTYSNPPMHRHIVLVEDDEDYAGSISEFLTLNGMNVTVRSSSDGLADLVNDRRPEVVILDQFIGGSDMLGRVRGLRNAFDGPIVMLSGNTDPAARVDSLDLGADDYISKIASPREILARIRAMMRRGGLTAGTLPATSAAPVAEGELTLDGWTMNDRTHMLRSPNGDVGFLTRQETAVAALLFASPGTIISRETLLSGVAKIVRRDGRRVDNLICRMRGRIRDLGGEPSISMERGLGYTLHAIMMTKSREPF